MTKIPLIGGFAPKPITPTREQIINVQSNFCNLRDNDDIPIFTIFLTSLFVHGQWSKIDDWYSRLRSAGSTHLDIGLTAKYDENLGWINQYPIPDVDLTNNLQLLSAIMDDIISKGFIPHLHLQWDDNGLKWGYDNLPSILKQLNRFTDKILWNTGWDGCFPTWNRIETINAIFFLRKLLGETAQIATEFAGPEGSDLPYIDLGAGQADYDGPLQELDVLLLEYGSRQFENHCGMQQQGTRLLGQAYKKPLIPGCDDHSSVYYLSSPRKRGRLNVCIYEWVCGGAYNQIRKLNIPEDAIAVARQFKDYGYESFGNGIP